MEAIFLVLALLLIAAIVLFPLWRRRSGCGPCSTPSTPPSSGTCYPSGSAVVQSGLLDFRGCSDQFYILGTRANFHFIEETT
jgi:hypothetical protein